MAVAALCASCSDWLDVQPSDRISEENNFSDVAGFKKALNGVYVELNRSSLYGRNLTCGFIEVLSQRYAVGDDNKSVKEYMGFNYSGSAAESILSDIWSTAYTLIANVNAILKNCELHRDVLSDEYYHLIRGEALALRAFLHFDLFRLFGPVYATNAADASIPYYTEFSLNVAPSYVGEEFMAMVTADLIDAEKELEDDPIIRRGVEGNTMDTFLRYRNLRLNYYAVQALLARAYYYMGDSENALSYAKKVIAVQEEKFPWINPMKLTNTASMDRVFSTEVLFAAQNLQRNDLFTSLFDGSNLKLSTLLAPREDVTNYLFDYDKVDYRYMSSLKNAIEISGSSYSIFNKYQDRLALQPNDSVNTRKRGLPDCHGDSCRPHREVGLPQYVAQPPGREERLLSQQLLHKAGMAERVLWRGTALLLVQAQPRELHTVGLRPLRNGINQLVELQNAHSGR